MLRQVVTTSVLLAMIGTKASAVVPLYNAHQLQARSNFNGAFNLPNSAFFSNLTASIDDRRQVAFKLSVLPAPNSNSQGLWFGGNGSGQIEHIGPSGASFSDMRHNENGLIVFQQSFSSENGLWIYNSNTDTAARETTMPLGATSWESPIINDQNQIGYRVDFGFNGQTFYSYDPAGPSTALHAAEVGVLPGSPYSFLFTPSFNNARQIAGKVRLGGPGQIGDDQPDEIRLFNSDGTSTLIAEDIDSDPLSPYDRFDNSVAPTDDGRVAFIATLVGGGRGVYLSDGTTTVEIVNENTSAVVDNIEFFGPAVNDNGLVAFRAFDDLGLRAIWVGDGATLTRVVREHDIVRTDLGNARIDQNDSSPVFGGSVTVNICGDLVFNAALTPPDNNQIEWGSGVFVARASLKGDMNADGELDIDDVAPFTLSLLDSTAYFSTFPLCAFDNGDINSDSEHDGMDIQLFIDLLTN
ncbi:MAG: hypothetical protein MI923_19155 [Phycisphaerales bacterium]|nr:hypothetical protein [Phycisphaerales bacterium]